MPDIWLEYFQSRCGRELDAPFDCVFVDRPGREAVARSIARFELGESGDGARLRALAAQTKDAAYAAAIELFVDEEKQHARWLGVLRERFRGERLESHWTDHAFVLLRHVGGLRLELSVLLTAELIALTYYRVLAESYDDPVLRAACERILRDERGHVAFHRETLGREFARIPAPWRALVVLAWRGFVAATVAVVAWDHRSVLALADVSRSKFRRSVRRRASRLVPVTRSHVVPCAPWAAPTLSSRPTRAPYGSGTLPGSPR